MGVPHSIPQLFLVQKDHPLTLILLLTPPEPLLLPFFPQRQIWFGFLLLILPEEVDVRIVLELGLHFFNQIGDLQFFVKEHAEWVH
jgi:hypothetical protein